MIVIHAGDNWGRRVIVRSRRQTIEQETGAHISYRSRERKNEPFIGWEPSVGDYTRRAVRDALRPNTHRNLGHTRRP